MWISEEDIKFTWLLNSTTPGMSDHCMNCKAAKVLWDTIIRIYSKTEDESRIAELMT